MSSLGADAEIMTPEIVQSEVVITTLTAMVILFVLGNWWAVSNFGEITGTIAIEMDKGAYIHALDNGLFTLGAPHRGLFQKIWKKAVLVMKSINVVSFKGKQFYG